MSVFGRIKAFLVGSRTDAIVEPRRVRREGARVRHHLTGGPAWERSDRHPGPPGAHEVQDIVPGFIGEAASHREVDG